MSVRRRWLVAASIVTLAAVAFFWWASRPAPLTAEERRFVGWWAWPPRPPGPDDALNPWFSTAVEYRIDRTVRVRWVSRPTGRVKYTVPDRRWRAAAGELIESYPRPNQDIVRELRRADFRVRHEYIYEVIWQVPDRYTRERYKIPGFPPPDGRGWPVGTRVRCDRPADAP